MTTRRSSYQAPVTHGAIRRSRSSLVRTTLSRTRSQWRLILAVAAVATLASVLVTSLSLLVSATEQGGVRGALVALPAAQRSLDVRLVDPTVALDEARVRVTAAIDSVLGDEVPATSSGLALSRAQPIVGATTQPTLAYFGELDGIASNAKLTEGTWAQSVPTEGGTVEVALPVSAAAGMSLGLGSIVAITTETGDVSARVVGLYEAANTDGTYWGVDRLAGRGYDSAFADPTVGFYRATTLFGPLVVAPGAMDAAHIPVAFLDITTTPDFSAITVAGLQPLLDRLYAADTSPLTSGSVAGQIFYDSDVADSVSEVAAGLVVTRSTVVVVSLLLAVLAIAALGQVGKVFMDARAGERQLMRARGASRRQIFHITLLEASLIAILVGVVTPPLAGLVYRVIALQPPMRAARMPLDTGITPLTWIISGAIAALFIVVLIAPLWRKEGSFVEGEQSKGRQRTATGIMHSGVDVALVAIAGIAYWQLQSYRTPVQASASLAIDPVLVAGPALALVAAALLCVRLIPAASRLFERVGARSRGSIVALAAWEIGRRSQRATAAVLLLSLTLGVGTFGLIFLTTWKQSQLDQASLAVGAPVRVQAGADGAAASDLEKGASGSPQPTVRRSAAVTLGAADSEEETASGAISVQMLALTQESVGFLARGRSGEVGGNAIGRALKEPVGAPSGIELAGTSGDLSATLLIADLATPLTGVVADIGAVMEQPNGLVSVVSLGRVEADGLEHRLTAPIRVTESQSSSVGRLVGLQARFYALDGAPPPADLSTTSANLLVKDLAWTAPSGKTEALSPPVDAPWVGVSSADAGSPPATTDVPDGWQLRLALSIPPELASDKVSFALVGWTPNAAVPAVLTDEFARSLHVSPNELLGIRTGGIPARIRIQGLTPLVPGSPAAPDLLGATTSLGSSIVGVETVVVDYALLARALVEGGSSGAFVDEWWIDVAPGTSDSYIQSLARPESESAISGEALGSRLQQAPLRVATQAALWVAIAASAALAAVGFGVQSAASLRSRRLELAQLRAIGFSRRRLVGLVAAESLLMSVLGSCFGVGIGILLAWLIAPLVAISPSGNPPVPSVVVEIPGWGLVALVLSVVLALTVVVVGVARVQRFTEPAHLLREGAQA